jgi:predicted RNase H-like nuclease (RuvC/YqgF family)
MKYDKQYNFRISKKEFGRLRQFCKKEKEIESIPQFLRGSLKRYKKFTNKIRKLNKKIEKQKKFNEILIEKLETQKSEEQLILEKNKEIEQIKKRYRNKIRELENALNYVKEIIDISIAKEKKKEIIDEFLRDILKK